MSLFVISTVVWLAVVFLSVISGIESNWLEKLTSVHAPLRIYPTEAYYKKSREFQSRFSFATLQEEIENPQENALAKKLLSALETLQNDAPLPYQEYEWAPSLMRLSLTQGDRFSQLSQMSYLLSFPTKNPRLSKLLIPPSSEDLKNLLRTLKSGKDFARFFHHVRLEKGTLPARLPLKIQDLQDASFPCEATLREGQLQTVTIDPSKPGEAVLKIEGNKATLTLHGQRYPVEKSVPLFLEHGQARSWILDHSFLPSIKKGGEARIVAKVPLGQKTVRIPLFLHQIKSPVFSAQNRFKTFPSPLPLWAYFAAGKWHLPPRDQQAVILPVSYRKSGALMGHSGSFSFMASTFTSIQEMQIPFHVVGFYDPGIIPIGNRCIYTHQEVTQTLLSSSQMLPYFQEKQNGFFLWPSLDDLPLAKKRALMALEKAYLSNYFQVETFHEYPFAKELMAQFQSDRLLFLLIATIMILVACSNIISMLIILVKDKKREIAILCSLGASKKSIACIFGSIGMILGTVGSLLGSFVAILTLQNLPKLVQFLSWLQGHDAFQEAFFGKTLPNSLSYDALFFMLMVTPFLSLCAGIIPAYMASRVHPTKTIRS